MKKTLISTFFLVLIISCKKENVSQAINAAHSNNSLQNQNEYLNNVKTYLKKNLSEDDYIIIDFDKAIATRFDNGKIYLLRLQFKKPGNEFTLLRTDNLGNCLEGMIINISYSNYQNSSDLTKKPHLFNGNIKVSSLKRDNSSNLKIKNGYIEESNSVINSLILPSESYNNVLPDVTVSAYIPSSGRGVTYGDYYNIFDLYTPTELGMGSNGVGTGYGYYSPVYPYDYSYPKGGGVAMEDPEVIAYEDVESYPEISVDLYMQCFDDMQDEGATCSIEIFTDLPVNGDPNRFFSWQSGSPGHTFLQIKKSNGSESVQQNIGFYPEHEWKLILAPEPIEGKLVDNAGHEFNASLKMNVTPQQLHLIINKIKYLAGFVKYDIDEYNCTDLALDVFNEVRIGNPIEIPKYEIFGGMAPNGTNTPQGLYKELQIMAEEGGTEASNITFPSVAGWVGGSHGPCY